MRTVIKVGEVTVDEDILRLGEEVRLVVTAKITSITLMQTAANRHEKARESQYVEIAGGRLGSEEERQATVERLDA